MARTEHRERERWPEAAQQMDYGQELEPDDRWPEAEPDERWGEPPARTRRTGRLRVEIPPIVNPYAIVALVAALLGLFPVAIVFGFIALSHPRGKAMAVFALLLGIAEVTAIAALVVMSGKTLSDTLAGANRATVVSSVAPQPTTVQTTVTSTQVQVPTVTTTVATSALAALAVQDTACTEAGLIGTTSDGTTLLCLGSGTTMQWSGPYNVASTVAEAGTRCDTAATKSARTDDGRALACEGKVWALWTE